MRAEAYDVVAIGGGIAGCAAATAAARRGAQSLLIERYGFLGGWATAALVNPFMPHTTSTGQPLIAGLFSEICDRLSAVGSLVGPTFDSESMKLVLEEMVLESGAELLLHTYVEGASTEADGTIVLTTVSKSGRQQIRCKRLIDCSGDGDGAVALGAPYESGDQSGLQQATTLMFDMGGIDFEKVLRYVIDHPDQMRFPKFSPDADPAQLAEGVVSVAGYYDLIAEARGKGEYAAPGDLIFFISRPTRGEVVFNTTHIGHVDGTNAEDLTRAEIEGRRQMMSIAVFVRKYVPGFEDAHLLRSAAHVGVRETRRVIGEHVFCRDDVIEARKYDDAVLRLAYPVDVHSGKGDGYTKSEEKHAIRTPPPGDWYEVPYRCLVPLKVDNVLVAGRCASSTQEGHGAIRIMSACCAMGEAAGAAAAMSLELGMTPRGLDGTLVRKELVKHGAVL